MKLEDQIVNLELSKKLKELGVNSESLFYWIQYDEGNWEIEQRDNIIPDPFTDKEAKFAYAAFTVAELGEMLPVGFRSGKSGNPKQGKFKTYAYRCFDSHCPWAGNHATATEDTEANARAGFLIYLLEHKTKTV